MTHQGDAYDTVIVGGGIAGLTAAAYTTRYGLGTLLCEKEDRLGGLVRTFEQNGFVYDGGIRAIESSGIVYPMLRQLGIEIDWIKSPVAIGIEDRILRVESPESLWGYEAFLTSLYPARAAEIHAIVGQLERIMGYLDVLYGIENPTFLDLTSDPGYILKEILPWMFRYALAMPKIAALQKPVRDHLRQYTSDPSLLDIIAQHFFADTPAFFALSYFSLYLDYGYPRGGTGVLPSALAAKLAEQKGVVDLGREIVAVDPETRTVTDAQGRATRYRSLIWAADQKALYRALDAGGIADAKVRQAVRNRQAFLADKRGGESILTLYLGVDLPPEYFAQRASAHFFYTPSREGQSRAGKPPTHGRRDAIEAWLQRFLPLTTYEISCPVLRDASLAPLGQTGLIVSILFDHDLTATIEAQGWYDAFKTMFEQQVIGILEKSVFPGLGEAVVDRFSSTPLTLGRLTGNTDGAITGWAFTNAIMPAEHRMIRITRSVRTPIPEILQAGQWTYSPSGLPISVLTGKLAADRAAAILGRRA